MDPPIPTPNPHSKPKPRPHPKSCQPQSQIKIPKPNVVVNGNVQSNSISTDLEFTQINLRHCKKATYTLCRSLRMGRTKISLIQEPWVRGKKIHGFGQLHDRLLYCKTGIIPRAAIYVEPWVKAMVLNQFTTDDVVAVRVCRDVTDGGDYVVISAYLPYDSKVPPPGPELLTVVEFCERENIPILIGTDSNSHHTIWSSTDINLRGEQLVQYLMSTNLMVINSGRKPTFVNSTRKECLDITLASCEISDQIHSWRVADEETFSDHRLIKFSLRGSFQAKEPYRNPKKTNWNLYRAHLRSRLSIINHLERYSLIEDLEKANKEVTSAIVEAYKLSCPLISPKPFGRGSAWSNDLEKRKKELRKAWNKAGKKGKDQAKNRAIHRALLKEYNQAQAELKEKCKKKFFEEADSIPAYARVHKILAKDPTVQVGSLLKSDGNYTENSKETVEYLLGVHFPGCAVPTEGPPGQSEYVPNRHDWKFAERIVKRGKVKFAIHKFHSFKSAGLDEIFPALLKEGIEILSERLISIFRSSIALSHVPSLWENVKVVFIPKPGKTTHTEAKDFRPISLTSFLLKTIERLLDFYIRSEVLRAFPLHANQHAYQLGKSTDTALHQLTEKIESSLKNGEVALGCFMDIEGAFDNTEFEVITNAAKDRKMENAAVRWIIKMLSGRTVEAAVCGTKSRAVVTRGCPQGGILSPILWCMVIDSLLTKLNDLGFFTQGYSDDVSTLIRGFSVSTIGDLMRTALTIVETWCQERNLKVNPVNPIKTKVVLFRRTKTEETELGDLVLFGTILYVTATVKYLGVIFDNRMTWIAHLEHKIDKAIGIFWMCRSAINRSWGLSPKAIWWIYTAVVRPILCHGCIVWWPRIDIGTAKKRLDKLQRLACLCITGVKNTTATMSLEALLFLPPLDLYIKTVAFKSASNIKANGWWTAKTESGHAAICRLINDDTLKMPSDQCRPELWMDDRFKCVIPDEREWLSEQKIYPPVRDLICYTDGSKREGLTGAGFFSEYPLLEVSLSTGSYATVYQTELFAIAQLCESDTLKSATGKEIYICTDSQSAIDAISSPIVDSFTVRECKTNLNNIGNANKVTILWVPSHTGIPGNEKADTLAGVGTSRSFIGPEPYFGISKTTRKSLINKWLTKQHQKTWKNYDGARHTKIFCKTPSKDLSEKLLNLSRPNIKRIIEVITNHCGLNKHLYDIGIKDNPKCLCGHSDETGEHIILDCIRYRRIRTTFLGKPELTTSDFILHELDLDKFNTFLERTRRLD